jgi:ABC-type nitrate/sulfonate/bicarbonate transport system substrate-binding protein
VKRESRTNVRILIALSWIFLVGIPPARAENLKVPFASLSANYAPLWVAHQAGFFRKYGLDAQPIYVSAGSVIIPALLSGQVDMTNMGSAPALTAWARGAELVSVGVGSNRQLHVVMTSSAINGPEELKGKRIGSDRYGSLSDLILREALRYHKLAPDRDVAIFQAGGQPERLGALKSGAVDGAILSGDSAFQAEKLGFHTVIDLSQMPIQYPGSTIVVSKAFLRTRREAVKNFLRGWIEGIKSTRTDKELTIRVLQKYLKTEDPEILARTFELYKNVHEKIPYPEPKVMGIALKQLSMSIPQATQLKIEDFTDRSLIAELESEGLIARLYGAR